MQSNRIGRGHTQSWLADRCDELAASANSDSERADFVARAAVWRRLAAARLPDNRRNLLFEPRSIRNKSEGRMASNEPVGDNARKGAVKKRTQLKARLMGKTAWTKRNKKGGQFMAVKKGKK